jgi:hypothetical protein
MLFMAAAALRQFAADVVAQAESPGLASQHQPVESWENRFALTHEVT